MVQVKLGGERMDGGFHTEERDDQPYRVEARSGEFRVGHRGQAADLGKVVKYSYRMVHSQKSIRVLDLRLDFAELENIEDLPGLLADAGIVFLAHAIQGELESLK